jgi:hypothetical protein
MTATSECPVCSRQEVAYTVIPGERPRPGFGGHSRDCGAQRDLRREVDLGILDYWADRVARAEKWGRR